MPTVSAKTKRSEVRKLLQEYGETLSDINRDQQLQLETRGGTVVNRERARAAERDAAQKELDAARKARDEAIAAAGKARDEAAKEREKKRAEAGPGLAIPELAELKAKGGVVGTFSGSEARGFGGTTIAQKLDKLLRVNEQEWIDMKEFKGVQKDCWIEMRRIRLEAAP